MNTEREIQKETYECLEYWRDYLEDYQNVTDIMPLEMAELTEDEINHVGIHLEETIATKLCSITNQFSICLSTIMETAWGLLLQKYTYSKDVVYGKWIPGVTETGDEYNGEEDGASHMIPLRLHTYGTERILDILLYQQQASVEGETYSNCTMAELERVTGKESILTSFTAFQSIAESSRNLRNPYEDELEMKELLRKSGYKIAVSTIRNENEINMNIFYNTQKYSLQNIEIILMHLHRMIEHMANDPYQVINTIDVLPPIEMERVLKAFNDTATEYPRDKTVIQLLEEQVRRTPDKPALKFGKQLLTYRQFNEKANQLARKLRAMGVGADDIIPVMAERSFEMLIGIYGILKSGAAYVPIAPDYPKGRIEFILEDTRPKAVVIYKSLLQTELPVINLESQEVFTGSVENLEIINSPDSLAYCLYTSGTTGKPKGVLVEHHGISAMNSYLKAVYEVEPEDVVLQFTNYIFDVSVWEMSIALLNGAELVLLPLETIGDIEAFNEFVKMQHITITLLPVQYYLQTSVSGLKVLTTGGSAANEIVLQKACNNSRYINAYGPTECTVIAACWEQEAMRKDKIIPIGKPISNTQIYILNKTQVCGIGMPGELCIAGAGVGRGYLNRPELTDQKFVANPFGEGKMYHTGDLARWLPDGNIEYLGRIDDQVKIRGFRIELGEVESAFRKLDDIHDCTVITRPDNDGEQEIHAYIVSQHKIHMRDLRKRLTKLLPAYMIPTYIMQIDRIPVTRSGKIDKRALPVTGSQDKVVDYILLYEKQIQNCLL